MVVWSPYDGSQKLVLSCPAYELLYHGTRGPGKTDVLLFDFLKEVGKGYGSAWRGVIFRRTYPELEEIAQRCKRWFPRIFPGAKYNEAKTKWVFPTGEQFLLRYAMRPRDYWAYHGWEMPWVGFDELTTWPQPEPFESLLSICRTSVPGVPKRIRVSSNPYGPGHTWVKKRYIEQAPAGRLFGEPNIQRAHIFGHYLENVNLMESSPEYIRGLLQMTDPAKKKAWTEGDWDVMSGGYFSEVWDEKHHVIPHMEPPPGSALRAGFDWGFDKPAYLALGAILPGTRLPDGRTLPPGSLYLHGEWYTAEKDANGHTVPNKGARLTNRQLGAGIAERIRNQNYQLSVADPSIFPSKGADQSVYSEMRAGGALDFEFMAAINDRITGWGKLRDMLTEAKKPRPEGPCLVVSERCREFIRTFPTLMTDEDRPDDLDTDGEDHPADAVRYLAMSLGKAKVSTIKITGT